MATDKMFLGPAHECPGMSSGLELGGGADEAAVRPETMKALTAG
jgi:hypothetical protein